MSCIVGLIQNGKAYMGCDGLATTLDGEIRPVIANKIIENGPYIIGYTGNIRSGQVIKSRFFEAPKDIEDLPDALRNLFEQKGCLSSSDEETQATQANFLIIFNHKLYEILIDFQLNEIRGDFSSIGAGSGYAFGSLFSTKKVKDGKKRVLMALNAAKEYCAHVGEPFTILEMENHK
jgi:ATP-dependent protease HslVU (ClpYQ) peptidase subunit